MSKTEIRGLCATEKGRECRRCFGTGCVVISVNVNSDECPDCSGLGYVTLAGVAMCPHCKTEHCRYAF